MKFKMAPNSLFAVLLRNPWWISFLIVGVFALASMALLPKEYVALGVMGSFPFIVIGCVAGWRQWHAPSPTVLANTLERVANMAWPEFANALDAAYTAKGFSVQRLKGPAADMQLDKGGNITLVSCKRWKAAVQGVEPLRELVAAQGKLKADQCLLISLQAPTAVAQKFAKEQCVALCHGDALAVLLNS
jgi:restriction system protein